MAVEKVPAAKKTTAKATTKKPATKTTVAKASTKVKKVATRTKKTTVTSPFERYKMIEVAAYYLAEQNGFVGDAADYWIQAEKSFDSKM